MTHYLISLPRGNHEFVYNSHCDIFHDCGIYNFIAQSSLGEVIFWKIKCNEEQLNFLVLKGAQIVL